MPTGCFFEFSKYNVAATTNSTYLLNTAPVIKMLNIFYIFASL